ncbi:hypothetical protein [Amycolatopsis sp. FDAARGOS 1241]|uniref:hypothetical protein n=1 Tax=Amycolatopsis sp. FDAARGOS 1241 TaxID=2778070 RepID=UPI001EF2504C|nr:hypothetical protein [Amycolatopsis sp. FDAARGOS 1241]
MSERVAMLHGDNVVRIHWKLGTDVLVGVCHCGAEHESEDPVELWDWLLAHPDGHDRPEPSAPREPVLSAAQG